MAALNSKYADFEGLRTQVIALRRQGLSRRQIRDRIAARAEIGALTDRELFMAGVALYWAEGSKDKTYARRERVIFINSDAGVISTYLAWLDLLGISRDRLRFRLSIHESADVSKAEQYWAGLVGTASSAFQRATLKKHNPKTVRKNVTQEYRGCLVIVVQDSAELYRRVEGWWYGIVRGATAADR